MQIFERDYDIVVSTFKDEYIIRWNFYVNERIERMHVASVLAANFITVKQEKLLQDVLVFC